MQAAALLTPFWLHCVKLILIFAFQLTESELHTGENPIRFANKSSYPLRNRNTTLKVSFRSNVFTIDFFTF